MTLQEKIEVSLKEYEEKLLNEKNAWSKSLEITKVEGPCEQVSTEDVMEAFALMSKKKLAGPRGVAVGLLNVCKEKISQSCKQYAGGK